MSKRVLSTLIIIFIGRYQLQCRLINSFEGVKFLLIFLGGSFFSSRKLWEKKNWHHYDCSEFSSHATGGRCNNNLREPRGSPFVNLVVFVGAARMLISLIFCSGYRFLALYKSPEGDECQRIHIHGVILVTRIFILIFWTCAKLYYS